MVAPGICHVKARLVDLIGSSGIENATSAQKFSLCTHRSPLPFLGEWLGTRLVEDKLELHSPTIAVVSMYVELV